MRFDRTNGTTERGRWDARHLPAMIVAGASDQRLDENARRRRGGLSCPVSANLLRGVWPANRRPTGSAAGVAEVAGGADGRTVLTNQIVNSSMGAWPVV